MFAHVLSTEVRSILVDGISLLIRPQALPGFWLAQHRLRIQRDGSVGACQLHELVVQRTLRVAQCHRRGNRKHGDLSQTSPCKLAAHRPIVRPGIHEGRFRVRTFAHSQSDARLKFTTHRNIQDEVDALSERSELLDGGCQRFKRACHTIPSAQVILLSAFVNVIEPIRRWRTVRRRQRSGVANVEITCPTSGQNHGLDFGAFRQFESGFPAFLALRVPRLHEAWDGRASASCGKQQRGDATGFVLGQFKRTRAILLDMAVADQQDVLGPPGHNLKKLSVCLEALKLVRKNPVAARRYDSPDCWIIASRRQFSAPHQGARRRQQPHAQRQEQDYKSALSSTNGAFYRTVGEPSQEKRQNHRCDAPCSRRIGETILQNSCVNKQRPMPKI